MSAALSAAAVALLVQCAPKKDKEADAANKSSALVEGMDFSALEKSDNSPSAKTLLKMLKDNETPNSQILATALIELNVKADAKSDAKASEIQAKVDSVLGDVMKIADGMKATKLEELKKFQPALSEKLNHPVRQNPNSITIQSALENGEFQEYSGTSLLTVLWLKTPSYDHAKGVILIEDGSLKLAELRADKKIASIDSLASGQTTKDEGTTDDLIKTAGKKKLVQLDLFVVHEALKPYVTDAKAWSLKIQKASNSKLGLKIEEKDLTTNSNVEKSKLNQSEILIGLPRTSNTQVISDDAGAAATPDTTPAKDDKKDVSGDKKGDGSGDKGSDKAGTKDDPKAVGAATTGTASGDSSTAADKGSEKDSKPADKDSTKPGFVSVQSGCNTVDELQKLLADAKPNSLKSQFSQLIDFKNNAGFFASPKSYLVMVRLEALKADAIMPLSAELGKTITDALAEAQKNKVHMVLLVSPKGEKATAKFLTFANDTGKYLKVYPEKSILLETAAIDYLKNTAKGVDISKDTHLIVEMKTENNCLK